MGCNTFHKDLIGADIHVVHAFTYANAAARTGATGLLPADIGKVAKQSDNNTFWVLVSDSPVTWSELTNSTSTSTDEKAKVSANDTTPGYLNGKLVVGTNITFTENNDGSNETLTVATTAEINTASNVGAGGVGLFKQKTGVNLEFRNINGSSNKISVALDTPNNEVDIDVVEANLTLNNIGGTLSIAKGGTGQITAALAFGALSPLTTKGDLLGFSTVNARIPIGTNGQVLAADSTQALGLHWITPTAGTVTSVGLTMPSIFSVAGSPVTSSGTLAVTLATESANTVFAGPTTGAAAVPTFRSLVAADIPSLSYVTSVGLSAPAELTVSGSPVTSSGTLTLTKANQSANTVWAGPSSGAAAQPTFRALTANDIPDLSSSLPIDQLAFEDFWHSNDNNLHSEYSFVDVTANGGTAVVPDTISGNDFGGCATISTGTTLNATGRSAVAGFNSVGKIVPGGLRTVIEQRVRIPTLSTAGTSFTIEIGLMNGTASGLPTSGIYFFYTHGTNSGQWRCTSRSASTSTNRDSAVAVVANQWYKLKADVDDSASSVIFYIDGVQIGAAVTTNIPTTAMFPAAVIEKSNTSLTSRSANVDYFAWKVYR